MSKKDYISIINSYPDILEPAEEFLTSLLEDISKQEVIDDRRIRREGLERIAGPFKFIDLVYILNAEGDLIDDSYKCEIAGAYMFASTSDNEARISRYLQQENREKASTNSGRKNRDYFRQVDLDGESGIVHVTEPYLSTATGFPCISASVAIEEKSVAIGEKSKRKILVMDADLSGLQAFLNGDVDGHKRENIFNRIYRTLLVTLGGITGILFIGGIAELVMALKDIIFPKWDYKAAFFSSNTSHHFDITVFLDILVTFTVALAMLDLVKTLWEEEIIFYKDLTKPSPARRTVIRFITAILIALSIETLVQVFKVSHMGETDKIPLDPISMLYGVTALLIGLAVYIVLTSLTDLTKDRVLLRAIQDSIGNLSKVKESKDRGTP
ncbi:MAG: hypothetical protein NPIRA06_03070 [Nitrospirales bacterium]|nr:MAG: hypothetical protein NPIRA06_03070 [Nitrospirales bacterium]